MNAWSNSSQSRRSAAALRAASLADHRLPKLPPEYRHALVRDLTMPCKPLVYPEGLQALAKSLHRMRQGCSIELQDRLQRIYGEEQPRLGVLVYTRDADRWAWRCLGWAWLDGRAWRTLRDALDEMEPDSSASGKAAFQ